MRIGFDLDGVLYDWHTMVYEYLKTFHGLKVGIDDFFINWVFGKYSTTLINNLVEIPYLYNKLNIRNDVLSLLNDLSRKNELFYITYRPISVYQTTVKWLVGNKLPYSENLIFTNGDKTLVIRKNKINYFIDDTPKVVNSLYGITTTVFVKKPWHFEAVNSNYIIKDIMEVKEILKGVI